MAHCSQPLLPRLVQHRFRCTSGPRHRRSAMRSVDRLQVQTSSGWMDIGNRLVTITGGSGDAGTVLHMKGHTGAIRIMTTIAKAGECTRDIGTMRTTTMAAGEAMIMIATIMIATVTTDRRSQDTPDFQPRRYTREFQLAGCWTYTARLTLTRKMPRVGF